MALPLLRPYWTGDALRYDHDPRASPRLRRGPTSIWERSARTPSGSTVRSSTALRLLHPSVLLPGRRWRRRNGLLVATILAPLRLVIAWQSFDVTTVGREGAAFTAGRSTDATLSGVASRRARHRRALRYPGPGLRDLRPGRFSTQKVNRASELFGGAFDGSTLYFVPNEDAVYNPGGFCAIRHDPELRRQRRWGVFDLAQVSVGRRRVCRAGSTASPLRRARTRIDRREVPGAEPAPHAEATRLLRVFLAEAE